MNRFFTLLLAASCLTAVGQVPDYVPTDGLVAWYPFDGNGLDESPNLLDVNSESNSPAVNRFGQGNAALRFENAPIISSHPQLNLTAKDTFTVSLWLQIDDISPSFALIGNDSGAGEKNKGLLMYGWGAGLENFVWHVNSPSSSGFGNFSTQVGLEPGVWIHLVYIKNGNDFQFYKDGMPFGFGQYEYPQPYSDDPTWIGGGNDCCNIGLIGQLDDLGVWNHALSSEEVDMLFNWSPISGCTDDTACNFNFDAELDDDSCLYPPHETLRSLVELSSSSELQVSVPQGLSSWSWSDGVQDSTRTIQPFQEYVLNGFVGQIPELGEECEGGVVFAIDTIAQTAFLATNESVGSGAEWGCKTTTTGATSTAFGSGQTNTQIILDACQDSDCAARLAASVGPDWYLPSRDELEAIRVRLHNNGLASYTMNNTYNWYWSSTECLTDGTAATDIHFSDGFVAECNNKDSNPGGVIAVKNSPINFCSYTDTLRIELDGDPLCGIGTVWDDISQTCIVANPSDSNFDGCVQLNDLLDLLSAYGDCGAEESPWQCGDPLEYQGYDYETVQIGEQCWFAENLRAENYRNGDLIHAALADEEWINALEGMIAIYGGANEIDSFEAFGYLYNRLATQDERLLCPSGWKLPTLNEWNDLATEVGGFDIAGAELKSIDGWANEGNGYDSFEFGAGPGGTKYPDTAQSEGGGEDGYWWTTTPHLNGEFYWFAHFSSESDALISSYAAERAGLSVRCIKDAE